jgi:hypothetical protein
MTKGEMVELVYLYVSGGQLNADINIKREDIAAMLSAAINYVVLKESRIRRQESVSEWAGTATGIDGDFLGTFYLDVLYDTERELFYVHPTVRVVPLPSNRGIDTMAPIAGYREFKKLKGQFEDIGIEHVLRDITRYWFERLGEEQRIFFKNIPSSIKKVILKAVVSAIDLTEGDEVPVPSGTEFEVLQLLQQWFSGEKQIPEDLRNNNSDGSAPINLQKNPIK